MNVVIVSKTRMRDMACVGALALDDRRNIRLLQSNGKNQPQDTPYQIGEVWDLQCRDKPDVLQPHVEDILVDSGKPIGKQGDMEGFLRGNVPAWHGGPQVLFDGLIRFTGNGSGYICRRNPLPNGSVGFWVPSVDLTRVEQNGRVRFRCESQGRMVLVSYVGFEPVIDVLPRNTLLRVSLARWWKPTDATESEERCYLQLSGWYGVAAVTQEKVAQYANAVGLKTVTDLRVREEIDPNQVVYGEPDELDMDRENLMELGLDPDDPDFTDLAPHGMSGDETDDEDEGYDEDDHD